MQDNSSDKLPQRHGVRRFYRKLVAVGVLGLLTIFGGSGYGIFQVYQRHIINGAEEDALHTAEFLIAEQRDLLFSTDPAGRSTLDIDIGDREDLDRRLRRFLPAFEIVKIKIYDTDGRIAYSTEEKIVGRVDAGNPGLLRALLGEVDSHLEHKESMRDLANERHLDVDVVETYVPIRMGGEVAGAFEVYVDVTRYREDIYSGVIKTMLVLSGILLLVFGASFVYVRRATRRLAQAQEQLREMATIDALTRILNRGTLLARAREEVSRAERMRRENPDYGLGFILLDIDYFKKVNDTYGHLTGDQVLREIAERVAGALRDYDLLGRYGGEEFLVILPDSTLQGTVAAAERIRQAIRGRPFVFEGPVLEVTVSLGVATAVPGEQDLSGMLKRADDALYRAKAAGRDRVAVADPPAN